MILLGKMSSIQSGRRSKSVMNFHSKKSLNTSQRKQKLVQITIENYALLKRMQGQQPTYSTVKWQNDRKTQEKQLMRISRFPDSMRRRKLTSSGSQRSNLSLGQADAMRKLDDRNLVTKKFLDMSGRCYIAEVSTNAK